MAGSSTTYVGLDIHKDRWFQVMEIIHHLDGVAKVHCDFDKMFERPGKASRAKLNGGTPPLLEAPSAAEARSGLKAVIVEALYHGPKMRREIIPIIVAEGYSENTLGYVLNTLKDKDKRIVLKDRYYHLTDETREAMDEFQRKQQPARALPAPKPEEATEAKKDEKPVSLKMQGLMLILRHFKERNGQPEQTAALRIICAEANLPPRTIDNALQHARAEKLLENVSPGVWKSTAKGLRLLQKNSE
jgi:hypothetical protein